MKKQTMNSRFKLRKVILWDGNEISKVLEYNNSDVTVEQLEQYRSMLKNESGCEVYFELKEYPIKSNE